MIMTLFMQPKCPWEESSRLPAADWVIGPVGAFRLTSDDPFGMDRLDVKVKDIIRQYVQKD